MKSYVVGFAFSENKNNILLIEKLRPEWQKNSLNGIGGKIEAGEMPSDAMDRECMEETGLKLEWEHRGVMSGMNGDGKPFECHIFYTYNDTIWNFEQKEDEPLNVYAVEELHDKKMIRNLRFLIPFGQHNENKEFIRLEYQ
ncbi:NUDIX domain-containing protein [Sulfurimonas marina]|uniref:NUDIX domain-containing protein n=1 Tax=Sulfurimonas marina TaxID=2590551 RepID=A0A7M1AUD5_9BACT|nr:NUDIX domain-containing protein [Sulfurimonas marina]QOP41020.1 NUDIX domain-containing protein [Sulfurimonas marina]